MSNDIVEFESTVLPKAITSAVTPDSIKDDLSGGVVSSFPVISYRGKVWRLRKGDEEVVVRNEDNEPKNNIELVVLRANPQLSKLYYSKQYSEGDDETPDCWSVDGVIPDSSSINKQAVSCATCPNNVWGSRITEAGKKSKACADSRRTAVAFPTDLTRNGTDAKVFLLRVPAASLALLKEYGEILDSKGYPYFSVLTRVSFETDASYPKFIFRAVRPVSDEEAEVIMQLRDGDKVENVLGTTKEIKSPAPSSEVSTAAVVDLPVKTDKKKKKKKEVKKESKPEPEEKESDVLSELDDLLSALD